jgi:hypothetical protein
MEASTAALRHSIKDPIPAIFEAWKLISDAADAHIAGNFADAESMFRQADLPQVWHWLNPAWVKVHLNVNVWKPEGDTEWIAKTARDPVRLLRGETKSAAVRAAVLARDGYRCRYCGIPVVDADIRDIARALYPAAIPWHGTDPARQHAAFQCFWLQYDHVVPHSHGGPSTVDNVVITCALCNFGKDKYTLKQLGLSDPRLRPPEPCNWDGLERLRVFALPKQPRPKATAASPKVSPEKPDLVPKSKPHAPVGVYFLPGAWISGAYMYTPELAGKERWFPLDASVIATQTIRGGVAGCQLQCDPAVLLRRGMRPEDFRDTDGAA